MVERSRLGALTPLGSGNSGDVFAISGSDQVYKEINSRASAIGGREWAVGAVEFWRSLSAADRAHLASFAVWPTDTVEDRGRVVGVVMPRIPAEFWHTRVGYDGTIKTFDNAFKWLMQDRVHLAKRDLDVTAVTDTAVKVALLAQVADAVAWLHARGVVFGDISYSNFVFALNPPRALLLDCDAVATSPATRQGLGRHTPAYTPPEHQPNLGEVSEATDVYKLGILTLSVLTPGDGATQRKPRHLKLLDRATPARLTALLTAALDHRPAVRPSAADLAQCLTEYARRLNQPPVANRLELEREVVRRGDTGRLRWDFDVASLVTVELPGGQVIDLDLATHATGCTFTAQESGLVVVHATNRYGTSTFVVGALATYDAPAITLSLPDPPPATSSLSAAARTRAPSAPGLGRTVPSASRLLAAPLPRPGAPRWTRLMQGLEVDTVDLRHRLRRLAGR